MPGSLCRFPNDEILTPDCFTCPIMYIVLLLIRRNRLSLQDLGRMWKARRGPAGTRSRAVEEIAEMGPLPRQGESVLRVSALPRAEAGSMHCLTADGSAGLSMMAELVEQYVLEEAHRDPGLIEAGMDFVLGPDARIGVSYNGQIANDVDDHGISGSLFWQF